MRITHFVALNASSSCSCYLPSVALQFLKVLFRNLEATKDTKSATFSSFLRSPSLIYIKKAKKRRDMHFLAFILIRTRFMQEYCRFILLGYSCFSLHYSLILYGIF